METFEVSEFRSMKSLDSIQADWEELHGKSEYSSFYNGFTFIKNSYKHFLPNSAEIFVIALTLPDSGEFVAIFPLQYAKHRIYGTTLSIIEYAATDETDKPYPLLLKEHEKSCWEFLIRYLDEKKQDWDFIELIELRDDFNGSSSLLNAANRCKLISKVTTDVFGPVVALDGSWDEFWAKHKKMRQKVRAMEKKFGDSLKFEVYHDYSDQEKHLDQYIELEHNSWKAGKLGISKDTKTLSFYKELYNDLAKQNKLYFGFLLVDDLLVSGEIAYTNKDTVYFSHGCYHEEYKKFSTGMVSTSLFIRYFHNKDFYEGDFLSGFAHYLNPWSKKTIHTKRITLYRKTLKSLKVLLFLKLSNRIYRPLKNVVKKRLEPSH